LNIVENIEKFNNKYTSNISSDYGENELKKNIDKWTYNDNKHDSKNNESNVKADKVLEQVLIQYNEFFIKLTNFIPLGKVLPVSHKFMLVISSFTNSANFSLVKFFLVRPFRISTPKSKNRGSFVILSLYLLNLFIINQCYFLF
jgi:hypothetical protein